MAKVEGIGKCDCLNESDKERIIIALNGKIEYNRKKMFQVPAPATYIETKEYENLKNRIEKIPIC